ncbi:MAG: Holliday junction resolvase RuvX [Clostridia bacterium]|nr:Holliday junction resolvase RuvX [Clostridia bacterium]
MIAKRVIAFDIGDKRIGVAVSDPFNEYAMPCETYFRTRSFETDVRAIAKIAADKGVGVIVCGLPVFTDGTESEQTEKTRRFIAALEKATELPIVIEDERFTTAEAKETQMLGGVKQSRRKQTVDSIAASFILESYLKKQKNYEKEKLMKEQISTEEYEDELERIIELEDEDGNVEKYLHIGTIEYRSEWYCFFQKAEPETEEEEDEVVMFRLVGEGDDKRLETLDDEQLMDEVFAEFCHQYEDFENSEEAMQLE